MSARFTVSTVRVLAMFAEIETGGRVALAAVNRPGDHKTYFCDREAHRVWTAPREAAAFYLGTVYGQRHRWPENIREAFRDLDPCGPRKGEITKAFHVGLAAVR